MNKIRFFIFVFLAFNSYAAFATSQISGTQKSFSLAFKALLKSDGASAEELDIRIGKLIKTHPTNFLKALNIYRNKVKRLDALVGNLGPEYVDDFPRQKIVITHMLNSKRFFHYMSFRA